MNLFTLDLPDSPNTTTSAVTGPSSSKTPKLLPEQIAYRKEIVNIWDAQLNVLRSKTVEAEEDINPVNQDLSMFEEVQTPIKESDDETASVTSRSSVNRNMSARRLVISRVIKDPLTGEERTEVETIEDGRLISAYLNQRRQWERKRRRREIAAAASAARAKKPRPQSSTTTKKPKQRSPAQPKPKKEVFVKCGTCGQIGHMRTNRICPRYHEYEAEVKRLEEETSASASSLATSQMVSTKISISKSVLASAISAPVPPIKLKLSLTTVSNHLTTTLPVEAKSPPLALPSPSPLLQYIPKARKEKRLDSFPPEKRNVIVKLTDTFTRILDELLAIPDSWPFHKPVSKVDYPHYFKIVTNPLDLGTIKGRIKRYIYSSSEALLRDIQLVRDNCIQFNGPDHVFSQTISNIYTIAAEKLSSHEIKTLEERLNSTADDPDQVDIDDS